MKDRKCCFWSFGWGWKRGEILVGSTSFLSFPSKTQSLQIGEKIEVKSWQKYLDKIAHIFFLLFFFWQLQSGRNKCGLPTICCIFFFFFGFHWTLGFFILFKYDDVHESVIHHSTIQCFFFFGRFFFLIF